MKLPQSLQSHVNLLASFENKFLFHIDENANVLKNGDADSLKFDSHNPNQPSSKFKSLSNLGSTVENHDLLINKLVTDERVLSGLIADLQEVYDVVGKISNDIERSHQKSLEIKKESMRYRLIL